MRQIFMLFCVVHFSNCFTMGTELNQILLYNGTGFKKQLQDQFHQAINDASIFYSDSYQSQTWFIQKKMKTVKEGIWNIFIISNLTIAKITDISTGLYYYTQQQVWAMWYGASNYDSNSLHIALFNGHEQKSSTNVSTQSYSKGAQLNEQLQSVINSIVKTLDSSQDISKYITKYDGRSWSVLSIPVTLDSTNPQSYGSIDADEVWLTYSKNSTMNGKNYSQIIYV